MKLNTPKTLLVFLMFAIGLLVPIVSVIRLQTLVQFGNAMNVTCQYVPQASRTHSLTMYIRCLRSRRLLVLSRTAPRSPLRLHAGYQKLDQTILETVDYCNSCIRKHQFVWKHRQ